MRFKFLFKHPDILCWCFPLWVFGGSATAFNGDWQPSAISLFSVFIVYTMELTEDES